MIDGGIPASVILIQVLNANDCREIDGQALRAAPFKATVLPPTRGVLRDGLTPKYGHDTGHTGDFDRIEITLAIEESRLDFA